MTAQDIHTLMERLNNLICKVDEIKADIKVNHTNHDKRICKLEQDSAVSNTKLILIGVIASLLFTTIMQLVLKIF